MDRSARAPTVGPFVGLRGINRPAAVIGLCLERTATDFGKDVTFGADEAACEYYS